MTLSELPRRTNRLPGNPNIEHLKNQAKDILRAHKSGDEACAEVLACLDRFKGKSPQQILAASLTLQEVQHALARSYDWASWPVMSETVAAINGLPVNGEADPVLEFVNKMMKDGLINGAAQIFFEPYEFNYRVRHRIDGALHTVASPPVELGPKIAEKLKAMASLPPALCTESISGRFPLKLTKSKTIDFRIDVQPMAFGEKINLSILDVSAVRIGFEALGLDVTQVQLIRESMQQRRGLVLFAGPKDQGRTVTMLTAVNELNKPANEISSVEEPVEVHLEGVNQTSISSGDKTTMVKAIKSSLLLSPDALVVSEIKNAEVARVVMEAAESGQYLLSTVFAQSWADALLRMRNWSEGTPSLLDSISMIVVQKLVRRLCSECKAASQVDDAVLLEFGFLQAEINDGVSLFEATGCQKCHGGYRGRAGVFEVMALTPDVLKAAIDGADIGAVETLHKSAKHPVDHLDFHRSALRLAKAGVTSMDEIRGVLT